MIRIFFLCQLLALGLITSSKAANPKYLFKLATLAPEGSNWVTVMRAIDREIRAQTEGEVGFKIYPGGVQGGEIVILRKMRIGQLHGGGFGALGTSQIFPDIRALEIPFLFNSYEEIDYILEQMEPFYQQGYEENGYVLLGWADIGFIHILSKQPVAGLQDIKGLKVWRLENEPITAVLFHKADVTSVPLTIPDVLLGLQTNLIDVAYASPAAAIVLQWFSRVKYLTELPINYTLGTLLVSKKAFYRLSVPHQEALRQIAKKHMLQQITKSRQENTEALQVMRDQGIEFVAMSATEVQAFKTLVDESVPELVGTALSQQSYDQIKSHLRNFRRQFTPPK